MHLFAGERHDLPRASTEIAILVSRHNSLWTFFKNFCHHAFDEVRFFLSYTNLHQFARDEKIQRADDIINREEIYRRLKDEVWDVELVFNTENTLPPNVFGDRKNPRLASPFKTVSEAKKVMYASYAIIWAKLMQQRLDSEEAATIESVAEETLNKLGIDVDIFDPLFGTITSYLSPGSNWKWNHSKDLFKWYKEVCERQSRHSSPLPPEAQ